MTRRTVTAGAALACALALAVPASPPASAAPAPIRYATTVHGDDADVYAPADRTNLPVALLLQGANVDKAHYSAFARAVADLGFAVVVPNHRRSVFGQTGLYTETAQAAWTVEWMRAEDGRAASPLRGRIDERSLVLLGHSFGGATGLTLTTGACAPPFCADPAPAPAELKGAALYGTNNAPRGGGANPPVPNTVPVALVQGGSDGVGAPAAAAGTYDAIQRPPKMLVSVTGANHYGLTDGQNPAGALPDPSAQTLGQHASIRASARWSGMFLRTALGDRWAAAWLYGVGDAVDKDVTVTYAR
ncbi:alpha/beta hydrolase family protein [Spirillospora sp. NPDC127200]